MARHSWMIRSSAWLLAAVLLLQGWQVDSLASTTTTPRQTSTADSSSRRNFLQHQIAIALLGGGGGMALIASPATAYERRDVGDPNSRSATTAAFNEQAYQTNNRLEREGFKLDTREEEQAKLSAAMASFSYESSSSNLPKKTKTGYGTTSSSSSSSSSEAKK